MRKAQGNLANRWTVLEQMTLQTELTVCVFAYGSNMCTQRIRSRVPSATPVANGYLGEYAFVFHKRSIDGSAKADAAFTGCPTDRVWGVVYRLHQKDKPILDGFEFFGIGYDEQQVDVVLESRTIRAWIYVARPSTIDKSLKPYGWYLEFVIQGAYQHRLPLCYIADLHWIEPTVDPDPTRDEANRRLLVGNTRR